MITIYVINSLIFEANGHQECNLVASYIIAKDTNLLISQSLGKSTIFSSEISEIVTTVETDMFPTISLEALLPVSLIPMYFHIRDTMSCESNFKISLLILGKINIQIHNL